jgi:hypothetical protein
MTDPPGATSCGGDRRHDGAGSRASFVKEVIETEWWVPLRHGHRRHPRRARELAKFHSTEVIGAS